MPGKPLNLVGSIPFNNQNNVSPDIKTIKLMFDKNVVSDSVWENNRKQIDMWKGSQKIAIKVRRIPDTVDFEERNNIYIKPVNPLSSCATYKVRIKPDMTSKAGETLDKTIVIVFKTRKRSGCL